MTLDQFRPASERFLEPFVSAAVRLGLTPDAVSGVAFGLAVAAGLTFAAGGTWYLLGAACILANGWLDLVDGALARELETASPAGDLVDHVLDRYADVIIIAGLSAGVGQYALGFAAVVGVLLTSYLGTQAQAVGAGRDYGGLLGRADRLALVGVAAVLAPFTGLVGPLTVVGWLLVVFAVVGNVTALQRFVGAWRDLR